MVKFYIGEVSSYRNDGTEIHVLERLDCVLTVEGEKAIELMDAALREAWKGFIRSDSEYRTVFDMSILEEGEIWKK